MAQIVYITRHCADRFMPEKFKKVKNEITPDANGEPILSFNKPTGGLWACDVRYDQWDEIFGNGIGNKKLGTDDLRVGKHFKFTLSDDARILHLYKPSDISEAVSKYNKIGSNLRNSQYYMDFESLSEHYDVIAYHLNDEVRDDGNEYGLMSGLYWALYGWDIDSILVMNKNVVMPIND